MRARSLLLPAFISLFFSQAGLARDGEEIPPDEAGAVEQVVQLIRSSVQAAAEKDGHAYRDAHRKHHGCVQAEFAVLPGVPENLRYGVFAESRTYSSWVRYSNGSGQAQDDHSGDGRGMAVKLLGVDGPRNLNGFDEENTSQDFLMINHPVFFVRNAADYVGFQKAATESTVALLAWLANPFRAFHEGRIAITIQSKKMTNPLDSTYWSMTASKLGPRQMKFRAVPCAGGSTLNPSDSANRLAENLTATLRQTAACFNFEVQLRTKPADMPVEDPTIEWSEDDAPFTRVAQIKIPRQKPEQGEFCEALSFNPWNGLTDLRPLGGISRARKEVYAEISRLRHDFNRQKREEPKP